MNNKTLGFIFNYIKGSLFFAIVSIVLSAAYVAGALYIPYVIGKGVDALFMEGGDALMLKSVILLLIIIPATALSQYIMNLCNNRLSIKVVEKIRKDAIVKLQKLPVSFLDSKGKGELLSMVIADTDAMSDGLLMGFNQFFVGLATILGTLCLLLMIDFRIALLVLLITPLSLFISGFISKKTYVLFDNQSKIRGEQTGFINEMVSNVKTVKAFGHEDENIEKFGEINKRLVNASTKAVFYSSLVNPSTRFVNSVCYALVAVVGAMICMKEEAFTVGLLTVALSYANQYAKPFNEITGVITELQNALACAERIRLFLSEEEMVILPDGRGEASDTTRDAADTSVESAKGEINIKDVSFGYSKDKVLIQHLSLDVKPGVKVAIVGPTGCGKTTLINLLMRFYDPLSGHIYLDGRDVSEMSYRDLRDNFGMVLQETYIRKGTVAENIKIGKPDASMEEIIEASKRANAHSFIKRLPKGYDTELTEDGGNLSTGQKQLICIARVMLIDPSILILDEATSNIDTRTEIKVQKAFGELMRGRTSFIVAHRLFTIKNSDIILVMKDGNVIEQGSHDELMAKNGFYTELYNSQFT